MAWLGLGRTEMGREGKEVLHTRTEKWVCIQMEVEMRVLRERNWMCRDKTREKKVGVRKNPDEDGFM